MAAQPRRAPLQKIGAACPSLENFGTFSDVSDVLDISNVFGHFRAFLDLGFDHGFEQTEMVFR